MTTPTPAVRHVNWKHIDGPLMVRTDGTMKWLSLRERFMHWIGRWSLEDISARRTGIDKAVYYAPHDTHLLKSAKDEHP